MLNKRSLLTGGLSLAGMVSLAGLGRAQAGKLAFVFVGHEL